jgi:hypothetical protein
MSGSPLDGKASSANASLLGSVVSSSFARRCRQTAPMNTDRVSPFERGGGRVVLYVPVHKQPLRSGGLLRVNRSGGVARTQTDVARVGHPAPRVLTPHEPIGQYPRHIRSVPLNAAYALAVGMRWPYGRGYTGRNYHVTGEHEAEAIAAQRAKRPSRIGLFVLRLLGFKGSIQQLPDVSRTTPSHEHPHRHPG